MIASHNVWRYAAVVGMLVAAWAASACEPGHAVEYRNTTAHRVTVYEGGALAFSLEPHESKKTVGFEKDWLPDIKVVADDGRILLEEHITLDELKKMNYKIVIADPAQPASPTPTPAGGG